MARYPGFVGPSYTSQSRIAAYDRCVNWFPERIESGTGVAAYWLCPAPGYASYFDFSLSGGVGRGIFASPDRGLFYVFGQTLYQNPSTSRGTVSNTTDNPVAIIFNGDAGDQLLVNADDATYCYDLSTTTFTDVSGATQCTSIGFLNGYFLRLDPNLSEVSFSALFDGMTWDALDVFQRNDAADRWTRLIVNHNEIYLFGDETTSIYAHTDDPDTPFQPIQSAFIPMGIVAPFSATVVDGQIMWVGRGSGGFGIVYRMNGYTPVRVSTHAVEYAISLIDPAIVALAEGVTYQEQGHTFYVLTFPPSSAVDPELFNVDFYAGSTWVFDATEGLWAERGVANDLGDFDCLDTRGQALFFGQQMAVSRSSGLVYVQSLDTQTFNGSSIVGLRRAPHIFDEHKGTIIDTFELHLETGLGLGNVPSTTVGYDPMIAMRFSNNGGQTWSNTRLASAGRIGQFNTRAEWHGLGYGRDRIIEVSVSAPVPWRIIDAFVNVRAGRS
jgi:hypothetical protein